MCGGTCTDITTDPSHCGTCGTACTAAQACIGSACVCRPGLTTCGGACADTLGDRANCGSCGTACTMAQRCVEGVSAAELCPAGSTNCGGGCYTAAQLAASPLHCRAMPGVCGMACANNQVCVAGVCRAFFTSDACTTCPCTTCPCAACPTGDSCCDYPGTTTSVCVAGGTCPH